MSHDYRLTPEAQANVDKICGFIAEDSVDAALRVLDALENAFRLLAATPSLDGKNLVPGEVADFDQERSAHSRLRRSASTCVMGVV